MKSILCTLGFHKWGRKFGHNEFSSNVIDWTQRCKRCSKTKHWVEAKKDKKW